MVSGLELVRAVYGALLLARFDRDGLRYFEDTIEAFWRSFTAAIVVAPGFAILILLGHLADPPGAGPLRIVIVEVIAYVLSWVAYPLAMVYVTRAIDRDEEYFRYIVAYNWAHIVQMALILLGVLISAIGLVEGGAAKVLSFGIDLAILVYAGYIARAALNIAVGGAVGIVIFDLILSQFIRVIALSMERGP